jgi:hypothetical protein
LLIWYLKKNALTATTFAVLIDGPLKKISASHNGIVVRAIHDDILLSGCPEDIFGVDDGKGALEALHASLQLSLSFRAITLSAYLNQNLNVKIPFHIFFALTTVRYFEPTDPLVP